MILSTFLNVIFMAKSQLVANQKESSPQFLLVHTDVLIILKPDVPHRNPETNHAHLWDLNIPHILRKVQTSALFLLETRHVFPKTGILQSDPFEVVS